MASMTSVISFLILLLATYSYSAPFVPDYENSTAEYEYTTGKTIVEHGNSFNMQLMSDDESTGVPNVQKQRSSEESSSEEVTTQGVTSPSSSVEDYSYPSSTGTNDKRSFEDSSFPSSTEDNDERSLDDYLFTTMESSTEFDRRAIRSDRNELPETRRAMQPVKYQEEFETSTPVFSEDQMGMTTDVEPSSSVDTFGKYTGLLYNEESSTPEYEPTDRSNDESTTRSPVKKSKINKNCIIFPGKITETKIYANAPGKTSVVVQPVEEEQLSQVSTIAIVKSSDTLKRSSRLMEMDVHLDKQLLK